MRQGEINKINDPKAGKEYIVIEDCYLLDFLLLNITDKSRNNIKSLLSHREVSVDGCIVTKFDYKLKKGQTIRISRSVNRDKKLSKGLQIVYEDNDLIVINKPSGLLTIASDKEKNTTAYRLLNEYIRQSNPSGRVFVVHRLDRDTSGLLMFAKNECIKLALQDNWDSLVSHRGYIAVVEGQLKEKSGRIRSWLKETKTFIVYSGRTIGDGLEAITNYEVINETACYSMLKIQLETGRKNQIRVHMKELGHSVVGDSKYGAETNPLKRLGLHAYKLEFKHPFSEKMMSFETEIPKNFMDLMKFKL